MVSLTFRCALCVCEIVWFFSSSLSKYLSNFDFQLEFNFSPADFAEYLLESRLNYFRDIFCCWFAFYLFEGGLDGAIDYWRVFFFTRFLYL